MKTILIDDDIVSLELLKDLCESSKQIEIDGVFSDPRMALGYAKEHEIEFVLSDIIMPGINGIDLAVELRNINPKVVIGVTTACYAYCMKALESSADVDFYLMKPFSEDRIMNLIERAYYLSKRMQNRLRVTMIGNFSVMLDGRTLKARNAKARELLALCLDHRGGLVTREEAIDKLWPGRTYDANTKKLLNKAENYIKESFARLGFETFFRSNHSGCYINTDCVECDYYTYLKKNEPGKLPPGYLEEFDWVNG